MESLDNQIVVSIQCLVYNHAPYIRQCLDGFVMQKTNFRFEAIVHDDASTDGTQDIIKEYEKKYPDIIKPIYQKENQYSKGIPGYITNLVSSKCKGKYIAMCEGDDYWTDPYKLQKQVDYLDEHPECGLVYTNYKKYIQENQSFIEGQSKQSDFDSLLFSNNICTLTTLYRKGIAEEYRSKYQKISISHSWKMGDYPLWLYIAAHSEIKYLEDVTGVYRVLSNSASHSQDYKKSLSFLLSSYDIRFHFAKEYQKDYLIKNIAGNEVKAIINISNKFNKNAKINVTKFFLRHQLWHPRFYLLCLLSKYKKSRKFAKMLNPFF